MTNDISDGLGRRARGGDRPRSVRYRTAVRIALAAAVLASTGALQAQSGTASTDAVTVAFIGDQSTHQGARDVLNLVRDEGTDLLVIQGDFGYSSPSRWIANHEEILGPRFPVLGVVGNHEEIGWPTYQRWLEQRIEAIDASGQAVRDTTFRVAPQQSAQLVSLDPLLGEAEAGRTLPDGPAPTTDDRRRRDTCVAGRLPAAPICRVTR